MKTISVKTWLPLFPGFYNTIYQPDESNEIDIINSERAANGLEPLEFGDFQFDYDEYEQSVVKGIMKFIESNFPEFVKSIELESISHPREYNFANDSANVTITLTTKNQRAILKYLKTNSEQFADFLKSKYTSRSGFISSYPNSINSFMEGNPLEHEHKLGSILEFIFENENRDDREFYFAVYYTIEAYLSCTNYSELLTLVKEEN